MEHFNPFEERDVLRLEPIIEQGWKLKRYAILVDKRNYDEEVAAEGTTEALVQLPKAGSLANPAGSHGIGFQIVHFAETAVISSVF